VHPIGSQGDRLEAQVRNRDRFYVSVSARTKSTGGPVEEPRISRPQIYCQGNQGSIRVVVVSSRTVVVVGSNVVVVDGVVVDVVVEVDVEVVDVDVVGVVVGVVVGEVVGMVVGLVVTGGGGAVGPGAGDVVGVVGATVIGGVVVEVVTGGIVIRDPNPGTVVVVTGPKTRRVVVVDPSRATVSSPKVVVTIGGTADSSSKTVAPRAWGAPEDARSNSQLAPANTAKTRAPTARKTTEPEMRRPMRTLSRNEKRDLAGWSNSASR
jgi:hypothetical protein